MTDRAPEDESIRRGELDPRELLAAGLIGELIIDIRGLASTAATLAAELVNTNSRVEELRSLRRRNAILGLSVAMLVLAGVLGTWGLLGRLNTAVDSAQDTNRLISECVAPAPPPELAIDEADLVHECYDASLARQRENVARLDAAAVDAAVCAAVAFDQPPEAIEACYHARAAARTTTATPGGNP